MTAVVVFTCLFLPLTVLSYLSAGRDLLLFQPRVRVRRTVALAWMLAGFTLMVGIGMPPSWALALATVGPAASATGHWLGSGEWIVLAHRLRRGH